MTPGRPKRLDLASIAKEGTGIAVAPDYDPATLSMGWVHLGVGAFHRAHQAHFVHKLLANDPRWGICAASLHSRAPIDGLASQDGLYVLAILDANERYEVVGAIRETAMASESHFMARFASASTRIVTLTITEKGYCLDPQGGLDFAHPDIAGDLANPGMPASAIGCIVRGLAMRRIAGGGGLAVLSCDNLSDNGRKLEAAVLSLAETQDPELACWIRGEVRFPNSMVDSITPASDQSLRSRVEVRLGLSDAWPVQREAFASWILEDILPPEAPDLESVGVVLTADVAAHERAKLRMLNGAHSTLAYVGLAMGHATVSQAIADARLSGLVDDMMALEIAPGLKSTAGLQLDDYRRTLLGRFRNTALAHRLDQIAWDGSQKLPVRLLGTIAENLETGRGIDRLCLGVAAWMRFVRRKAKAGESLVDPLQRELLALGGNLLDQAPWDVPNFLRFRPVFPPAIASSDRVRAALEEGYRKIMSLETTSGIRTGPECACDNVHGSAGG